MMNTFFDLREFLIAILKKAKLCIIITTICIIGGIGIRFVPLAIEYMNYHEVDLQTTQEQTLRFPYQYQSRRTIYFEPQYKEISGNDVDITPIITNAYLACYQNREVLQPLVDQYYSEAVKDFNEYNQKLVEYNYRTKSILTELYTLPDFYGIVRISTVGNTEMKTGNYINIYATTGSEELSEQMVSDAEQQISKYVKNLIGDYDYTVTEGQTGMITPQATGGLIPKQLSAGAGVVVERPELSFIIKRSIKGGIWGFAGGIGVSVFLCFLFNCLSLTLVSEADMKEYNVLSLATVRLKGKKHFLGFINHWIDLLEGNDKACQSNAEAASLVAAYLQVLGEGEDGTVVISGATSYDRITELAEELKTTSIRSNIVAEECINRSAKTVTEVSRSTGVVLVEEVGKSNRQEIHKELERIKELQKTVYGIVLIK